jgi:drug/metabolite transporter (DMT)-like permease
MSHIEYSSGLLGPLAAFLSSLTWALGVSYYSQLTDRVQPFVINFTRAIVALPLFLIVFILVQGTHSLDVLAQIDRVHFFWLTASIFASYALGDVLFLLSTEALGVPAALAIASIYPVWSALAGFVFYNEALNQFQLCGLLAIVTGVIVIILCKEKGSASFKEKENRVTSNYLVGVGLALASSFFWALNTFSVARGGRGIDPIAANLVRMGVAVLMCPLISLFFVGRFTSPLLSMKDFTRGFWIFILEGFAGSYFYLYGLTHSRLAVASALSSLAPALSIPIAIFSRKERLTLKKCAGIFLIVIGIWFLVGG